MAPFRIKNSKCKKKNNHSDNKNDKNESKTNDVINSKLIDIKTQDKDEIVYYSKCMVNSLISQHALVLSSDHECESDNENKKKNKKDDNNSEVERIRWDYDSIRHEQFNFTRYLCKKYFKIGMCRKVANLIAIYAGLSKYDYKSGHMPNPKKDINICFIKLNGKLKNKLSSQNIVDNCKKSEGFSNYGKRVPMQSFCEIPFDCTKLTDWIWEGYNWGRDSYKKITVNIEQIRAKQQTYKEWVALCKQEQTFYKEAENGIFG